MVILLSNSSFSYKMGVWELDDETKVNERSRERGEARTFNIRTSLKSKRMISRKLVCEVNVVNIKKEEIKKRKKKWDNDVARENRWSVWLEFISKYIYWLSIIFFYITNKLINISRAPDSTCALSSVYANDNSIINIHKSDMKFCYFQ